MLEEGDIMLHTVWAIVREGGIELLESVDYSEGVKVLITLLPEEDTQF
jgi:hypothetical protein